MEKFCLTGLPPEVNQEPADDESLILQALRAHAARCWSCRTEALCDDGASLADAYMDERTTHYRTLRGGVLRVDEPAS
jgi:hypothetical protein